VSTRKIATIVGSKGTVIVRRDSEWQEYTYKHVDQPREETGGHTDDKDDAMGSAKHVAGYVEGTDGHTIELH
jgi:hypothetical protein